ncbi:flavodoxin family protein [Puteibacter caeruleilacunae]|nr:flavodoxin family protein [Puteibacter caeruleilacunae]
MKIIGISGSPTKGGVLESAMTKVLESTGHEWELIRLSGKNIKFCRGCIACAATNRCVFRDDMDEIIEKIMEADAVVLGGITRNNGVNALMKNFMERLSPLFHRKMLLKDKPVALVSTGFVTTQEAYKDLSEFVNGFRMNEVGNIVTGGNASCYVCGFGETCPYSAHRAVNGDVKITNDTFYRFEKDSNCEEEATQLGQTLAQAI